MLESPLQSAHLLILTVHGLFQGIILHLFYIKKKKGNVLLSHYKDSLTAYHNT